VHYFKKQALKNQNYVIRNKLSLLWTILVHSRWTCTEYTASGGFCVNLICSPWSVVYNANGKILWFCCKYFQQRDNVWSPPLWNVTELIKYVQNTRKMFAHDTLQESSYPWKKKVQESVGLCLCFRYTATIPCTMHIHSTQKNFQQFFYICKRLKYCQFFT
jgi:hypothetical protein